MLLDRPTSADAAIAMLLADPTLEPLVAAHRVLEALPPRHAPMARGDRPAAGRRAARAGRRGALHPPGPGRRGGARRAQRVRGDPDRLGQDALLQPAGPRRACARDPAARALYLFPTKALAAGPAGRAARAGRCGRARPQDAHLRRRHAAQRAQRGPRGRAQSSSPTPTCSTPAILPHHTKWVKLFENLRYVVIDELHTYRGVFGSHVANVIRRLRRICRHYGSDPRLHLRLRHHRQPRRAGRAADRGAGRADRRQRRAARPRSTSSSTTRRSSTAQLGIRGSSLLTAPAPRRAAHRRAASRPSSSPASRTAVEVLPSYLRETLRAAARPSAHDPRLPRRLPAQRAARDRARPARRRVRGVVATNALELGIDIGGLDAAISVGYPGTIASTWQQMGRAGRRSGTSLSALVCSSAPIDQFLAAHPDYLFDQSPEHGLINPDNLLVLAQPPAVRRLRAARARRRERFGIEETADPARRPRGGRLPAPRRRRSVLLEPRELPGRAPSACAPPHPRTSSSSTPPATGTGSSARWTSSPRPLLVHEKAIYIHEGVQYHVDRLDWEEHKAYVTPYRRRLLHRRRPRHHAQGARGLRRGR